MPNFIHRTTARFLTSQDPNSLPEPLVNYIMDPDMSGVTGFSANYIVTPIVGDVPVLMDQAARDAVDAAADTTRLDNIAGELDQTQTILKAFAEVMLDQLNTLRAAHSLPTATLAQLKAAVRGKL